MGKVDDYFDVRGWPTTKEEAALAKEVVETAKKLREHTEKCKRLSTLLRQSQLLLAAGKYAEAVAIINEATKGATT